MFYKNIISEPLFFLVQMQESGKLSSFLTNGGRRMQQRITDTCLIGETMPQINKRERVRESIAFRFMPRIEMKMS